MTRKHYNYPIFTRGLDRWITREASPDWPHDEPEPEPSAEQMLLERIFDGVNALGGTNIDRSFGRYNAGKSAGYNEAIEDVLRLLEKLGARPGSEREDTP